MNLDCRSRWLRLSLGVVAAFVLCAASAEDPKFSKTAMLSNLVHHVVIPAYDDLREKGERLEQAAAKFAGGPDAASLDALQSAWRDTMLAWKYCQAYQFGPSAAVVSPARINYWPPRRKSIDRVLADTAAIDDSYMERLGATATGLSAFEYMIFDSKGGDAALLAVLADPAQVRRRQYLVALASDIRHQTARAADAWQDGAAGEFVSGGQDSLNTLVNIMIANVEIQGQNRIRQVISFYSNGLVQPDFFECGNSGLSRETILAVLRGARQLFVGGEGPGLDDQLRQAGSPIAETALAAFEKAIASLDEFDASLEELMKHDKAAVERAEAACKDLELALKLDMPSALGVFLTFRSADGD